MLPEQTSLESRASSYDVSAPAVAIKTSAPNDEAADTNRTISPPRQAPRLAVSARLRSPFMPQPSCLLEHLNACRRHGPFLVDLQVEDRNVPKLRELTQDSGQLLRRPLRFADLGILAGVHPIALGNQRGAGLKALVRAGRVAPIAADRNQPSHAGIPEAFAATEVLELGRRREDPRVVCQAPEGATATLRRFRAGG